LDSKRGTKTLGSKKTKPFTMPRDMLGFQIIRLAHLKKTRDDALFKRATGIGLTHCRLLKFLCVNPNSGAGQIARFLLIAPQSTAALIAELWTLGLVEKDTGRRRGARVRIRITDKGMQLLTRAETIFVRANKEVRMSLTAAEATSFNQLLIRVAECYMALMDQDEDG
jgi:DNA-binding MarR family transcriptional regulator